MGMRCEPLQAEVRGCAVKALEGASGVAALFEGAAESALAAAGPSPYAPFQTSSK